MIEPQLRNVLIAGATLGVVAALVVWWLERFETRRMIGEVEDYLSKHANFQRFLHEQGTNE